MASDGQAMGWDKVDAYFWVTEVAWDKTESSL